MTKPERLVVETHDVTEQELAFVAGGAEPTQNRKSQPGQRRSEVKDSHDRYANIEVSY